MESKGTTVVASCIHQALTDSHRYTTLTDATIVAHALTNVRLCCRENHSVISLPPNNPWTTPSTTTSRTTENQRAFKYTPHKGKPSNFILTANAHWSEQTLVTFVEAPQNSL